MRLVGVLLIGMVGGCEQPPAELQTQALGRGDVPPVAGFDLPEDGVWVTPGVLEGFATDEDQAPSTLVIEVKSVVDGTLFYGNPEGDGGWQWAGELTTGQNPIEITVVDREGHVSAESALLTVRPNAAPTCRILQPIAGSTFPRRTDIRFSADVSDADGDDLHILWRSSLEGGLADGESFVIRLLESGQHQISIEVLDPYGGTCTDAVTVFVD